MFRRVTDGFGEAFFITVIHTTVRDVFYDVFAEFVKAVIFVDNQFYVDLFGVVFQAVATSFIFYIRMDVGIVPKKRRLDLFGSQGIDAIHTTRCTTSMH